MDECFAGVDLAAAELPRLADTFGRRNVSALLFLTDLEAIELIRSYLQTRVEGVQAKKVSAVIRFALRRTVASIIEEVQREEKRSQVLRGRKHTKRGVKKCT